MTIYIPMIILTVFLADIQERIRYRGRKISILLITLLPPTLVAAFRYNNGADYPMYFQLFTRLGNGSKIAGIEGKKLEVGFEYIVRLCQLVTRNQWFTFGAISFIISFLISSFSKVRTYSIVKRELCPNLLNRAQNNGGWLTHLSAGVVSQSESSSDHTSILKEKSKAG